MAMTCEQVWREISNYLENDLDPALRSAMEEHFRECKHCASVLEGTRNVVGLYGDERLLRVPLGYSWRLRGRLAESMPPRKGTAFGWLVVAVATGLIVGSLTIAGYAARNQAPLLSEHAQPGQGIPRNLVVVVAPHTRVFHLASCRYIHDKAAGLRSMTAAQAEKDGYVPCVRCLGKYLMETAKAFLQKHGWATA